MKLQRFTAEAVYQKYFINLDRLYPNITRDALWASPTMPTLSSGDR